MKRVFRKRSSREAVLFRNLRVWRDSKAWLSDHLGIFSWVGGERRNCALASSEESLSAKLMSRASLKEMECKCLYSRIVLGDGFLSFLRNTINSKTCLFLRTVRCSGSHFCKVSPGCFRLVDGRLPEGVNEEIGYLGTSGGCVHFI